MESFTVFAHVQIGLDLRALYGMICFTGGIYSPLLIFVIFHIILAGILLPPLSCYAYGVAGHPGHGSDCWSCKKRRCCPCGPSSSRAALCSPGGASIRDMAVHYAVFAAAILITAFLITSLKSSLRTKGRELLQVSRDLESATPS